MHETHNLFSVIYAAPITPFPGIHFTDIALIKRFRGETWALFINPCIERPRSIRARTGAFIKLPSNRQSPAPCPAPFLISPTLFVVWNGNEGFGVRGGTAPALSARRSSFSYRGKRHFPNYRGKRLRTPLFERSRHFSSCSFKKVKE